MKGSCTVALQLLQFCILCNIAGERSTPGFACAQDGQDERFITLAYNCTPATAGNLPLRLLDNYSFFVQDSRTGEDLPANLDFLEDGAHRPCHAARISKLRKFGSYHGTLEARQHEWY